MRRAEVAGKRLLKRWTLARATLPEQGDDHHSRDRWPASKPFSDQASMGIERFCITTGEKAVAQRKMRHSESAPRLRM
jgi:hypothetical protein